MLTAFRLGLGAAVPSNYTEKARDDSLRRNMLGRKPTKALPETAKKRLTAADESDEDTGRSAVGSKRKRPVNNDLRKQKVHKASVVALAPKPAQTEQAAETAPVVKPVPSGSPKPVAAAGGPLSPSKKKKKKKNKKNKKSQPSE